MHTWGPCYDPAMPIEITDVIVKDIRFPTAAAKDGSDALNAGDYSATYVILRTSDSAGPGGQRHHLHQRPRQ